MNFIFALSNIFLKKIKLNLGPSSGRHSAHHVLFVQGDQNIQNLLFFSLLIIFTG